MKNNIIAYMRKIRYLIGVMAIIADLALAGYYYFAFTSEKCSHLARVSEVIQPIVPNLIAALTIFIVIYFAFKRYGIIDDINSGNMPSSPVKEFHKRHDKMEWGPIISEASTIDIVVFYYGGWVRQHEDSFVEFFRRGGQLRLILSDPSDDLLVSDIQKYFFPSRTKERLTENIKDTVAAVREVLDKSASKKAHFEYRYYRGILHYSFVLVDRRYLYISVYEQFRNHSVRSSVFEIDIFDDRWLKDYWLEVLDTFVKESHSEDEALTVR